MEDWLQATRGLKKGRVVGMPRVPAYTVVPAARARRRLHTKADGASGSSAGPSLSDEFFWRIIEACIESSAIAHHHASGSTTLLRRSSTVP